MRFLIISFVVILGITVNAKDVFRYVDEETGQSHYMTGEPGKSVEGGWTFTNADGTYELVYKADDRGFQPEAEHIPVAVEDTNEVAEAKDNFYSLFKEHEAKVKEALEGGFQPEAIEDTKEVAEAKAKFYSLFKEHEAKVKEALETVDDSAQTVIDIKKREAEEDDEPEPEAEVGIMEDEPKSEKMVYASGHLFGPRFHPYLGFVPNNVWDEKVQETETSDEPQEYKFVPYFGFVPAEETGKTEEESEKEDVRYKFDPLYGFVQVKKEGSEEEPMLEPMEEQEYKYVPYVGFVPLTAEDKEVDEKILTYKFNPFYGFVQATKSEEEKEMNSEEVKYKFVPYYGFVPVTSEKEEEEEVEAEEEGEDKVQHHLQYVFHPYHGYLPTLVQKSKEIEQLYTYDHMRGFVPVPKEEAAEKSAVAEEEVEEEAKRKKREAQVFAYPQYVVPYPFMPTYVVAPAVAAQGAKKAEVEEEKPETLPEVVDNQKVPLPGLVQVQLVQTPVLQAAQPLVVIQHPALPLPADQYPVIPKDPEQEEQGAFEF